MELFERGPVWDGETALGHDPGNREDPVMSLGAILVIVLILVLLGVIPRWGLQQGLGIWSIGRRRDRADHRRYPAAARADLTADQAADCRDQG
jgi:hypothetical protein